MPLLLDTLFRYDNHLRLFPVIAQRVPSSSNGLIRDHGKTVVIRLKRGLRWSSGREITSQDVKFGWRVAMDPASAPPGGKSKCEGSCDAVKRIGTPDRHTAILHLPHLFGPLLASLPYPLPRRWPGAWRDDPHQAAVKLFQDPTFNFLSRNYPTNGPYQVVKYVPNERVILAPMPYYLTMTCGAHLRRIVIRNMHASTTTTVASLLAAHTVDFALYFLPTEIPEFRRYGLHVEATPNLLFDTLILNVDRTYGGHPNPLHDVKVRQALALALPKYGMVQIKLAGYSPRTLHAMTSWTPWLNTPRWTDPVVDRELRGQWDPIAHRYTANTGQGTALAHARRLLSQTRWRRGSTLDYFDLPVVWRQRAAELVKKVWAKLGVNLELHYVMDFTTVRGSWEEGGIYAHGAFQVGDFIQGYTPDGLVFRDLLHSKSIPRRGKHVGRNWSGIDDPIVDRALDRALTTYNPPRRAQDFATVQVRLNQQAYWMPILYYPRVTVTNGRVRHWSPPAISDYSPLWNVYNWQVASDR